jgi:hypothetical protein
MSLEKKMSKRIMNADILFQIIDTHQSVGISDLSFPSFDKVTFKWRGHYGAKLFVRFKCLSTDFSRIKGVKGIPLRVQMESSADPYIREVCFCKVKLFRDKVTFFFAFVLFM